MTSKFCTRSPIRHHNSIKFYYWPRENQRFTFERCNERGVFHLFYIDTSISRVICVAISLQPITIYTIFLVDSNDHFSSLSILLDTARYYSTHHLSHVEIKLIYAIRCVSLMHDVWFSRLRLSSESFGWYLSAIG